MLADRLTLAPDVEMPLSSAVESSDRGTIGRSEMIAGRAPGFAGFTSEASTTDRIAALAVTELAVVRCDGLLRSLFGDGTVDPAKVASSCSETVEWVDMGLPEPLRGPANVEAHLAQRYPPGTRLVMERVADGSKSSGFAWHREAEGIEGEGLRGITYVELDDAGKIKFVQEGYESIFKLDKLLEVIFKVFSAASKAEEGKEPSFEKVPL